MVIECWWRVEGLEGGGRRVGGRVVTCHRMAHAVTPSALRRHEVPHPRPVGQFEELGMRHGKHGRLVRHSRQKRLKQNALVMTVLWHLLQRLVEISVAKGLLRLLFRR